MWVCLRTVWSELRCAACESTSGTTILRVGRAANRRLLFNLIDCALPMPESTLPVPVCPIHSTFMVPCTPEEIVTTVRSVIDFAGCVGLDGRLFYVHGGW